MKVKELAVIFKTPVQELLNILPNVGIDTSNGEETFVEKDVEKKLAKRYNIPYPFKTAKPKAAPKPAVNIATKAAQKQNEQKNENKPVQKPVNEEKTIKEQKVVQEKKVEQAQKVVQEKKVAQETKETSKPVIKKEVVVDPKKEAIKKSFLEEAEEIIPRIDEETLNKYQDFLEDDSYQASKPTKKKNNQEDVIKGRKKNSNKNKRNKNVESRTSNIPREEVIEDHVLYYEKGMTVMEVAEAMHIGVTELVKKLFTSMGIMASATNALDRETAELIAIEYDYELKDKTITDLIRFDEMAFVDSEEDLLPRPAIVTIMGHVDHGKTTLLDAIRGSYVVKGEAGGITQHIGAYQVEKSGKLITFIDTPGHAAFTEMRARGAQITDIVILVVAADDGVMPQTKEAIEHAQAAGVPIIVAVSKMDKPGVSADRIKQELTEYNLLAEEWGGDTIFVPISGLTGMGVDELLEMVILSAELKEYKANPNRLGVGTVIEAKLDKGRGPVATLLVQNGTLKVGDVIVVGNTYGKVRAMSDEYGKQVKLAGPAKPVEITGLVEVPFAGEKFMAINDERQAKAIAETRAYNKFNDEMGVGKTVSLNEVFKNQENKDLKELNLIIKCDVQGSIEAIKGLLSKIEIEGTKINVIGARVGGITDNDISLAVASNAIIVGFNIRPQSNITDLAKEKGIEIRLYNIIYKLQEDIEKAVKGMLDPVFEEKISGQAEVREIFKVIKVGTIAGSYVTSGTIVRNSGVRLIRDSIVIYTGRMAGLRRFKDDVKEVKSGYECGITIENFNDIKVGDIIECFVMEEVERD